MALHLRVLRNIAEVPEEAWDALARPLGVPILEWEWLRLLEGSGSITSGTGWIPLHLTLWRGSDLVAAAPLYVKLHSEGEFVWDAVWVDVARQLRTPYYPKLVGMSPATPIAGYRFLVAPGESEEEVTEVLLGAVEQLCRRNDFAGASFPFADPTWRERLEARGYLGWKHQSFVWEGRGCRSFDDYLAGFDHNQRKNVRRERAGLPRAGVEVRRLRGEEITVADLARMYLFYEHTNARFAPFDAKYLNEPFFLGLAERYRHRLLLFEARRAGAEEPVGMSLLLVKGESLYGRYWGAFEKIAGLHFELCYYGPIEWGLSHGIEHFEPGIGGLHKVRRGFLSVPAWSLHRFSDPRLQAVMAEHIGRINEEEQNEIDALNEALPVAEKQ